MIFNTHYSYEFMDVGDFQFYICRWFSSIGDFHGALLKNLDTLLHYINIVLGRTRFQTPNKSSVPFWRVCQSASSFFWLPNVLVTQVPDGWIPNPQHIVDTLTEQGFCTITCWIISIMIIGNNRNSHNNRADQHLVLALW